jgi:putative Mg2+ transporter-C (MgtC) family protein
MGSDSVFFNVSIFLRIMLAIILAGAIGLEREYRGRPAGLRTHILVCLGSAIIMISSENLFYYLGKVEGLQWLRIDPGRIAAGIVTGIGFLGAGAIIRIGDIVRGLTTAACIWFVAALGIVIGGGHYLLAVISTLLILLVLLLLDKFERSIIFTVYRTLVAKLKREDFEEFEKEATSILERYKIRIQDRLHSYNLEDNQMEVIYKIRAKNLQQSGEVILEISKIKGLKEIRWE